MKQLGRKALDMRKRWGPYRSHRRWTMTVSAGETSVQVPSRDWGDELGMRVSQTRITEGMVREVRS